MTSVFVNTRGVFEITPATQHGKYAIQLSERLHHFRIAQDDH